MTPVTAKRAKSRRIEMRVTPEEDELFRAAADLAHVSKTAFILGAAAERAEALVARAHHYSLPAEAFDQFLEELERPAEVLPAMADLFARLKAAS
jgi:uncharacterized protein (DUF1778 family)